MRHPLATLAVLVLAPLAAGRASAEPLEAGITVGPVLLGRVDWKLSGYVPRPEEPLRPNRGEWRTHDFDASVQLGGFVSLPLGRHFGVGVMTEVVLPVDQEDAGGASQLSLLARLVWHLDLEPRTRAFTYVAPGYAGLMEYGSEYLHGFSVGVGAGVRRAVGSEGAFVSLEVGYQLALYGTDVHATFGTIHYDILTRLPLVGVSAGTSF